MKQDNTPQPVQSLNQSTGEWTKGKAIISGEAFGKCRIAIVDGDRQQRLCSMYADFDIAESKANAERIVYAWNNIDKKDEVIKKYSDDLEAMNIDILKFQESNIELIEALQRIKSEIPAKPKLQLTNIIKDIVEAAIRKHTK